MDRPRSGEPLGVVVLKVAVEPSVDVQELSNDLDGRDFGVAELGLRAALADTLILEPTVDEAKGGDDEGAKRFGR